MEKIIDPIDTVILEKELANGKFVRTTNKGQNEVYIFNHFDSPNLMKELGRVREITFRAAGGGTGKPIDLDEFDTNETPYEQLIVWDPTDKQIVGGYRFIKMSTASKFNNGTYKLATTELFHFSEDFAANYIPYTIELGRSFVQPQYQPGVDNKKGMFSLDNLWDGLGAIVVDNPDVKYFFGKVTMYKHFNVLARDYILSFMNYFFPDKDKLVTPIYPIIIKNNVDDFMREIYGLEYKEAHKILAQKVRDLGEQIPPLVNSYMSLSPTMKSFGTADNEHFGDVEETGIMVTIADIYESKKERHIVTYTEKRNIDN
ncbi:MAG: GNAT family N-acetyltransferase [Bacteroidia bacterium]|nr:GNAT family N-acetyltransferase [Bacteroidia bacterium]